VSPADEDPYAIDAGPCPFGGVLPPAGVECRLFYDINNPTGDSDKPLFEGVPKDAGLIVERGGTSEIWEKVLRCQLAGAAFVVVVNNEKSDGFLNVPPVFDELGDLVHTNIGVPVGTISLVDAFDLLATLQEGVPVTARATPVDTSRRINSWPYVTVPIDPIAGKPLGLELSPTTCKGVFVHGVLEGSAAAASDTFAQLYSDADGNAHSVLNKQLINANGVDIDWDAADADVATLLEGPVRLWLTFDLSMEAPGSLFAVPMSDLPSVWAADAEQRRRARVDLPNGWSGLGNVHFVGHHHISEQPRVGVVLDDPYGSVLEDVCTLPLHICGANGAGEETDDPLACTGGLVCCGDYFSRDSAGPDALLHGILTLEEYVSVIDDIGGSPVTNFAHVPPEDAGSFAASDVGIRVRVSMPGGWTGLGNAAFVGQHHVTGEPRIGVRLDDPYGILAGDIPVLPTHISRNAKAPSDDPLGCTGGRVAGANYFGDSPVGVDDGIEMDANYGVLTAPQNVQRAEDDGEAAAADANVDPKLVVKIPPQPGKKVGMSLVESQHGLYVKNISPNGRAAAMVDATGACVMNVGCRIMKVGGVDCSQLPKKKVVDMIKAQKGSLDFEFINVRQVTLKPPPGGKIGCKLEQDDKFMTRVAGMSKSKAAGKSGQIAIGDVLVAIDDSDVVTMDKATILGLITASLSKGQVTMTFLERSGQGTAKSSKSNRIDVKVKAPTDDGWAEAEVRVDPIWTVSKLKKRALKTLNSRGVPLMYQGWPVPDDGSTLAAIGIVEGSTLYFSKPTSRPMAGEVKIRVRVQRDGIVEDHEVAVDSASTVRDLARTVRRGDKSLPKNLALSYQGRPLADEVTLQASGIVSDSTVYCTVTQTKPPTLHVRVKKAPSADQELHELTVEMSWTTSAVKDELRRRDTSLSGELTLAYDGGAPIENDEFTLRDLGIVPGSTLLCTTPVPVRTFESTTGVGATAAAAAAAPAPHLENAAAAELQLLEAAAAQPSLADLRVRTMVPPSDVNPFKVEEHMRANARVKVKCGADWVGGTIRWVGQHHETTAALVGVELDSFRGDFNGTISTEGVDFVYFDPPCDDYKGVLADPDNVTPDFDTMSRVDLTLYLERQGVDYSNAFTENDLRALARGEKVTAYNPFDSEATAQQKNPFADALPDAASVVQAAEAALAEASAADGDGAAAVTKNMMANPFASSMADAASIAAAAESALAEAAALDVELPDAGSTMEGMASAASSALPKRNPFANLVAPEDSAAAAPAQQDKYADMGRMSLVKLLRSRSVDYSDCKGVDALRERARETDPVQVVVVASDPTAATTDDGVPTALDSAGASMVHAADKAVAEEVQADSTAATDGDEAVAEEVQTDSPAATEADKAVAEEVQADSTTPAAPSMELPENEVTTRDNGDVEVLLHKASDGTWGLKLKEVDGYLQFKKSPAPGSVAAWGGHLQEGARIIEVNGEDAAGWRKDNLKPHVMGTSVLKLCVTYSHMFYVADEMVTTLGDDVQEYDNLDHGDAAAAAAADQEPPPVPPTRVAEQDKPAKPVVEPVVADADIDVDSLGRLQCIKILRQRDVDYSQATTIWDVRELVRKVLASQPEKAAQNNSAPEADITAEEMYELPALKSAAPDAEIPAEEEDATYEVPQIKARSKPAADPSGEAEGAAEEEEELYEVPERAKDKRKSVEEVEGAAGAEAEQAADDSGAPAIALEENHVYGEPQSYN